MIIATAGIIYAILCIFNVMKIDEEKCYYIVVGTMLELMLFDSFMLFFVRS